MSTESSFPGVFDAREQIVAWAQDRPKRGRYAGGLKAAVNGSMTKTLTTWERYKRGG